MKRWRSLLFVSALDAGRLANAHQRGADAIVLDLEDAIPTLDKQRAREAVEVAARQLKAYGVDVLVRINSAWSLALRDLEVVLTGVVAAVVVPKAESVAQVRTLSAMMNEIETERGLQAADIVALIESAEGLQVAPVIADEPRVIGLGLGTEDFAAQMRTAPTRALLDLPCRQIALAAAPRSLMALATPASIASYADIDAYADAARAARAIGATGAFCIHPKQVAALNEAFTPSAAECAEAQAIVAAWETAGSAGVISHEGRMIDQPVVLQAKRLLAWADGR